jgi:hypothetical protein
VLGFPPVRDISSASGHGEDAIYFAEALRSAKVRTCV